MLAASSLCCQESYYDFKQTTIGILFFFPSVITYVVRNRCAVPKMNQNDSMCQSLSIAAIYRSLSITGLQSPRMDPTVTHLPQHFVLNV